MTKEPLSSGSLRSPGPRRPLKDESSPGLKLGCPLGSLVSHFQGSGHSHPSPSLRGAQGPGWAPPPQPLAAAAPRLRSALRPLAPAVRARGRARLPASPPSAASVPPAPLGARWPQLRLRPRPREEELGAQIWAGLSDSSPNGDLSSPHHEQFFESLPGPGRSQLGPSQGLGQP